MKLFNKKELLAMKDLVTKQNNQYFNNNTTNCNSELYKKNKTLNNLYTIMSKK